MNIHHCIDELLMSGADDWVYAAEVTWIARSIGGAVTEDEVREMSLHLIREVVQQGLMEIGDLLGEDDQFRKWPMTHQQSLDRVEREWNALGRNPTLGEICWLCNTEKGDERGQRLLRQKEPSP